MLQHSTYNSTKLIILLMKFKKRGQSLWNSPVQENVMICTRFKICSNNQFFN